MKSVEFPPPRSQGSALHIGLIIVLAILLAACTMLAYRQPVGLLLWVYIFAAVLTIFLVSVLGYRLYALRRANYELDRDKLVITWGFREEKISISDIEWVRPLAALTAPVPLPLFWLPGSILGVRRHPEFGPVEFLASEKKSLLLVAANQRVFAISPQSGSEFLESIQRVIEMGSLTPTPSQSVYPSFVVAKAWSSSLARFAWMAGIFLNIGLLAWVSLISPSLGAISLGFLPSRLPRTPVSGLALILIPIVSLFFSLVAWMAGLIIWRREDQQPMAQIVWIGSAVSTLVFLVAVMLIVSTPA